MNSTLVRRALRSDAASLVAVRAAADPAHAPERLEHVERLISQDDGLVYVAETQGNVVGFLFLQRSTHPAIVARNPLQLWQLYVVPTYHGSGVAARLMATVVAHARRRNHDVVWLGVSEHNARARAFYEKSGFQVVGLHTVGHAEHAHQDVVMSCAVS